MEIVSILISVIALGAGLFYLISYLVDRDEKKAMKFYQEKHAKEFKENEATRKILMDRYLDTPLSRIGMCIVDGTVAYSSPITHWSWDNEEQFSSHRARVMIQNPTKTLFEDQNGIFYPRASILSFFIEQTDWYMDYNQGMRKKEPLNE